MEFNSLAFDLNEKLTLPPLPVQYIKCVFLDSQNSSPNQQDECIAKEPLPLSASELFKAQIISGRYLAEGHDVKTAVELFLNIKGSEFSFLPGDSIGIFPKNSKSEVLDILKHLGLDKNRDQTLKISLLEDQTKKKFLIHVPSETTLYNLLESCLEIRAIPKKTFLRALVDFTEVPEEKRRLEELCCIEGSQEYTRWILENGTCLLEILEAFPSCKPPLSLLIQHLPRLRPRAYSIASSPLEYKFRIRIVFTVVKDVRGRKGVCSSWLQRICFPILDVAAQLEDLNLSNETKQIKIPIYLRKPSKFRIPESLNSSLIMIGPGTGVAPFIGFLEHRNQQHKVSEKLGAQTNSLYFGCRYKGRDHIYRKELMHYVEKDVLQNLRVCFSRDKVEEGAPKYVQDLIHDDLENFVDLITMENTFIFICGDGLHMAKDVQETVIKSIVEVKGVDLEEATEIVNNLEKSGKLVKDVW